MKPIISMTDALTVSFVLFALSVIFVLAGDESTARITAYMGLLATLVALILCRGGNGDN